MLINFSPHTWYRLTNPSGNALDVINDAGSSSSGLLQTSTLGNYSGQFW
jgi:immune inhibitor A